MMRAIMALGFLFCGVAGAIADEPKLVGNWLVSETEDRFEGGGRFVAVTGDDAGNMLAVRCIEKELTLGIGKLGDSVEKYSVGDIFNIKLRVDKQPVVELTGVAINQTVIQVDATAEMVRSIRDGRETAVRRENIKGVSKIYIFKTRGSAKAFARLSKECKVD
jgi:hypothetical protein